MDRHDWWPPGSSRRLDVGRVVYTRFRGNGNIQLGWVMGGEATVVAKASQGGTRVCSVWIGFWRGFVYLLVAVLVGLLPVEQ